MCYRFSTGLTPAGKAFDVFVGILIILNVAAVVAEAEPGVGGNYQTFFDMFEVSYHIDSVLCNVVYRNVDSDSTFSMTLPLESKLFTKHCLESLQVRWKIVSFSFCCVSSLCTLAGVFCIGIHRRDSDASVHRADIFQVRFQPLELHYLILRHHRPSLHSPMVRRDSRLHLFTKKYNQCCYVSR